MSIIFLAEASEVNEAAEVLRPEKSIRRTSVSKILEFNFILIFEEFHFFDMYNHEILRPANVTFFKPRKDIKNSLSQDSKTRFYLGIIHRGRLLKGVCRGSIKRRLTKN